MKTLDLSSGVLGFIPENVVFAVVLGGDWIGRDDAFHRYMKICQQKIKEGYTHFQIHTHTGEVFPITKSGCRKAIAYIYGIKKTATIKDTTKYKWETNYITVDGEIACGGTLMPTTNINGQLYCVKGCPESGKYVGDYVGLTGGSSPFGKEIPESIQVGFYCETFNAGGGRVTAGISGIFYIPKKVTVHRCKIY